MRQAIFGSTLALAIVALTSGTALAANTSPTGVELGIRSGYALPFGDVTGGGGDALGHSVRGVVPIWIDAGYRLNPSIFVGASFQYGIGFVNTDHVANCSAGGVMSMGSSFVQSCSASDLIFGIDFHYHLMPEQTVDPWAGVGVGYEIMNNSRGAMSVNYKGFQFLNVQLGADYKAMPNLGIGPFVMFSFGQFSNCSISGLEGGDCNAQTAMHEWLTLGIRGAYDINLGH